MQLLLIQMFPLTWHHGNCSTSWWVLPKRKEKICVVIVFISAWLNLTTCMTSLLDTDVLLPRFGFIGPLLLEGGIGYSKPFLFNHKSMFNLQSTLHIQRESQLQGHFIWWGRFTLETWSPSILLLHLCSVKLYMLMLSVFWYSQLIRILWGDTAVWSGCHRTVSTTDIFSRILYSLSLNY